MCSLGGNIRCGKQVYIETLATSAYADTPTLYIAKNYLEQARSAGFYEVDEDKIILMRRLSVIADFEPA